MKHTIEHFRRHSDDDIHGGKKNYSREEVKAILWSQIAKIHNDINDIIYEHQKKETVYKGIKLRDRNEEEKDIMELLKNPRCVNF